MVILRKTSLLASLATSFLVLMVALPASVSASANVCLYPPTSTPVAAAPPAASVAGPWPTVITMGPPTGPTCPTGWTATNSLLPCGPGVVAPGEYCGPVTGSPVSTTTGLLWTCTVYPAPTVTLSAVVAGWDVASPLPGMPVPPPGSPPFMYGPPDGNVDDWDASATGIPGLLYGSTPGSSGEFTVALYSPAFPMPYGTGQIIVYPVATALLPLFALPTGCI